MMTATSPHGTGLLCRTCRQMEGGETVPCSRVSREHVWLGEAGMSKWNARELGKPAWDFGSAKPVLARM